MLNKTYNDYVSSLEDIFEMSSEKKITSKNDDLRITALAKRKKISYS